MAASYQDFYQRSIERPDEFWSEQARLGDWQPPLERGVHHSRARAGPGGCGRGEARLVDWHHPFERVLDYGRPPFARWFVGGRTNLCHNAVDRHLSTPPDPPA